MQVEFNFPTLRYNTGYPNELLRPKESCVYCNMPGKKNGSVGRDFFFFLYFFFSTQTTKMHILAVIMLITCENFVLFVL